MNIAVSLKDSASTSAPEGDAEHHVDATDPGAVSAAFRDVLGRFSTGVVVVTARSADGAPVGMTVGSFTSISLDPALVGFFAAHSSTTLPRVVEADNICINVLAEHQRETATRFARSGIDKFADTRWSAGIGGAPRIEGAHAWIDCTLDGVHTYGDHDLVVGGVRALSASSLNSPLVFHRSGFHGIRSL